MDHSLYSTFRPASQTDTPPPILSRSSLRSQSNVTLLQSQVDEIVTNFVAQSSDWKSLAALTAGGLAYRYGKIGVMGLGPSVVNRPWFMALRPLSIAAGLGSEVTAFEFTNRALNTFSGNHAGSPLQGASGLWSWSGPGGLKEGWLSSLLTFGTLKGFGHFAQGQNLILQHSLQDLGMVAGHQLAFRAGLASKPEGTFKEQFIHAEATNLQLGAGMGLSHALTGGRLLALEKGLDLSLKLKWPSLENGPFYYGLIPQVAASGDKAPIRSTDLSIKLSNHQMASLGNQGGKDLKGNEGKTSLGEKPGKNFEHLSIWERIQLALGAAKEWKDQNIQKINRLQEGLTVMGGNQEKLSPQDAKELLTVVMDPRTKKFFGSKPKEWEARIAGLRMILENRISFSAPDKNISTEQKAPPVETRGPPPSGTTPPPPSKGWKNRDYQKRMLDQIDQDLKRKISPWLGLASPMQTGKSYLIGPLIDHLNELTPVKPQVIILTSAQIITEQILKDLLGDRPSEDIGRFDGIIKNPKRVTVASMYSLVRHLDDFPRSAGPLVLINDEAVYTQAPTVKKIISHFGLGEYDGESRPKKIIPKQGQGIVIGFSGTGSGLSNYHTSASYDLFSAIDDGWVRPMLGERILLKISYVEKDKALGEKLIWWKRTPQNALALAEIFQDKILKAGYKKSLIFVPTIGHGELLQEALEKKIGLSDVFFVHSKMEDRDFEKALASFKRGGVLISVRRLSRGFRATGTEAVFHTYQTSSPELFSQRTGRAWGVEEGQTPHYLYVLEATWDTRDSFTNLSQLLGLMDFPHQRLDTREASKVRNKIKQYQENKEALSVKIEKGDISLIFRNVPLLENWRVTFAGLLDEQGGISGLAKKVGLSSELLTAFSLGGLPYRKSHMLKLKNFLGGEEKALSLWVESWTSVVDEALEGTQRMQDPVKDQLIKWRRQSGSLQEKVELLGKILPAFYSPQDTPSKAGPPEKDLRTLRGSEIEDPPPEELSLIDFQLEAVLDDLKERIEGMKKEDVGRHIADFIDERVSEFLNSIKGEERDSSLFFEKFEDETEEWKEVPPTFEMRSERAQVLMLLKSIKNFIATHSLRHNVVFEDWEYDPQQGTHFYLYAHEIVKIRSGKPLSIGLLSYVNRVEKRIKNIFHPRDRFGRGIFF